MLTDTAIGRIAEPAFQAQAIVRTAFRRGGRRSARAVTLGDGTVADGLSALAI